MTMEEIIDAIIRDVAELPNRTSPPDNPSLMTVTPEELKNILEDRLDGISA